MSIECGITSGRYAAEIVLEARYKNVTLHTVWLFEIYGHEKKKLEMFAGFNSQIVVNRASHNPHGWIIPSTIFFFP